MENICLIGVDVGTSATKTVAFDTCGKVLAEYSVEYPLYQPHNGWAEQEPDDWANAAIIGLSEVIKALDGKNVAGIGVSGQMHGLVMLDEEMKPIRRSIIWCDQRTVKECEEITEKVGKERLFEITCSPALTGFTASKLMWVKNNEPEVYAKCKHMLLPKDYVRYCLTGTLYMDYSDASGTQLLDIKNRCWSKEICDALDIDMSILPTLCDSCADCGNITVETAKKIGLTEVCPVAAGAGDNASAAVGCGVVEDGDAFATIGTSGVVFALTDKIKLDPKGRIHTFCSAVPGQWHVMGVTQAAGLSLKWIKDNLCVDISENAKKRGESSYVVIDKIAADIPIGSNGVMYLPYLMGERTPHLDPYARGAFIGLGGANTRNDMLRATMEGVSFSLKACLEIFAQIGVEPNKTVLCGGGAKSSLWRNMLTDVFDTETCTSSSTESCALGAAILAGVASGVYKTVKEGCVKSVFENDVLSPNSERTAAYKKYYSIYKKVYPALKEINIELVNL
ncbi:MAG: xylulokinase [Clostridia bacterium]|nr:xylulokinase [Clostridia bacterium]